MHLAEGIKTYFYIKHRVLGSLRITTFKAVLLISLTSIRQTPRKPLKGTLVQKNSKLSSIFENFQKVIYLRKPSKVGVVEETFKRFLSIESQ